MRTEYERGLAVAMLDAWYILTHLPDNHPNRDNCIHLAANRLKKTLQATGYMSEQEIFSQPEDVEEVTDGVIITPLSQFPDERGAVKLIMQSGDPGFADIQQVYVSTVYPGTVKGWHRHKTKRLNYVCISGLIRLVIAPEETTMPVQRAKPRGGEFTEIVMGSTNYIRVSIPPMTWNAFMGLGDREAVVVNCATRPYSEDDIERLPYNYFAYDWTFKHG